MNTVRMFFLLVSIPVLLTACLNSSRESLLSSFRYEKFRDSIQNNPADSTGDSTNIFDDEVFLPGRDSLDTLLDRLDELWKGDVAKLQEIEKVKPVDAEALEQKRSAEENVRELDSFFLYRNAIVEPSCEEKECVVYAEVIKSNQKLYLYIGGELKDSFSVSTGTADYETPEMSVRPSGPVFTKYTSKKFPGGNYKGMGNMPYAVFIRGGYAIHGTTVGNFPKLGNPASHGCIRLHPDHAKLFNELVKRVGLVNVWVSVKDSLP